MGDVTPSPPVGEAVPGTDAALARNWCVVLLRGLAAVVFGALALVLPGLTAIGVLLGFAAYLVIDGVCAIVSGVRAARRHERWASLILEGLAGVATAVLAFVWPGMTLVAMVLLLAAWALVSGALRLAAAWRLRQGRGRGWLAAGGLLSIVWGGLLVAAPLAGALALTIWLGVYAVAFGAALLVLAWRLRRERQRQRDDDAPAELAEGVVS